MRLGRSGVYLGLLLLFVLVPSALLFAQAIEKGAISGLVLDPSGAAVPGASVKITNPNTGLERNVTSGADGRYFVDVLPVGTYVLEVSVSGFATLVVRNVQLAVGQNLVQDVSLQLAAVGQTVEVTAESAAIDRAETDRKSVV